MIINNVTNQIYKIWSSDDNSYEAKGLDYENKTNKHPDLPNSSIYRIRGKYNSETRVFFTVFAFHLINH